MIDDTTDDMTNHPTDHKTTFVLLGSTGSIGTQTLDVVRSMPERYRILGLAAGRNLTLLEAQAREFRPRYLWAAPDADGAPPPELQAVARDVGAEVRPMDDMAADPDGDVLVVGTAGRAGLEPTLTALSRGADVALANKEVVVMAGALVRAAADAGGGQLRPVDSEHSAIWQCLWGEEQHEVRRIILTASGGALRDLPPDQLADVTPEQALKHPTWNMGAKITIDSATLMNKGMETIEARWLFDVPYDRVEVVQHAESIVHSLVEFGDGSVKAQLGYPDMKLPIQLALSFPLRLEPTTDPLDLAAVGSLNFSAPNLDRYPCLKLAMRAGLADGTYPAAMAAADEVAVHAFLNHEIRFDHIPQLVEQALDAHDNTDNPTLEAIDAADAWARDFTHANIAERSWS